MKKDFYSFEEASRKLSLSQIQIESLVAVGEMPASISLKSTRMFQVNGSFGTVRINGTFDIDNYRNIKWHQGPNGRGSCFCDLFSHGIRIRREDELYGFTTEHILTKDKVMISHENLTKYARLNRGDNCAHETESADPHTLMDLANCLNPEHPYYAGELAAAIESWMEAVRKEIPAPQFKRFISRHLVDAGLTQEAVRRIAIVTRPQAAGSGSRKVGAACFPPGRMEDRL